MHHPIIKGRTFKVTLPIDFDYLSAGETYLATVSHWGPRTKRAGKVSSVRFDRLDESSGTTLTAFAWNRLNRIHHARIIPAWEA